MGFPCGSTGKEFICNAGDLGSIRGLGRFPGEGKGYPLQYSGLENPMDCTPWGRKESDTTEGLTFTSLHIYIYMKHPRVWNRYPFQYSCLEGPMDRGTWQDTVHRVAQNWTQLSTYIQICSVQLLSHVQLSVTPWTVWSLPGSSVHGILQAWILEWVAISFSRGSSQPRDQTSISYITCIRWQVLYH